METIQFIEMGDQGILNVPDHLIGIVAQIMKKNLHANIIEVNLEQPSQNQEKIKILRYAISYLLKKFHSYCKKKKFTSIDESLENIKNGKPNIKKLFYSDLQTLICQSELKELFKLEWEKYLMSSSALQELSKSKKIQQNMKYNGKTIISLLLYEVQKNNPYQQVLKKKLASKQKQ